MNIAGFIIRTLFPPLANFFVKDIQGLENFPHQQGRLIVAINHTSFIDHLLLLSIFPYTKRPLKDYHFFCEKDYFEHFPFKYFVKGTEAIPIDRNGKNNQQALLTAQKYLENEKVIGIYPEGSRSSDGTLQKGKTGIAKLVLKTKTPVLPIALLNASKIWPKGGKINWRAKTDIKIQPLLAFSEEIEEAQTLKRDSEKYYILLRKIVNKVMHSLAEALGQNYLAEEN